MFGRYSETVQKGDYISICIGVFLLRHLRSVCFVDHLEINGSSQEVLPQHILSMRS